MTEDDYQRHMARTDSRLTTLEYALQNQQRKLDEIFQAVTRHEAAPQFDPYQVLKFMLLATTLFGLVASGVIYVATNVTEARLAVLEVKVNQLVIKKPFSGI